MGITPQQFQQLQQRVASPKRTASAVTGASLSRPVAVGQGRILGIDPSLRGTGYGIIDARKSSSFTLVTEGTISCPAGWERSRCLAKIAQTIRDLIKQHQPEVCVVESLFYAQNLQTALIMGEARGASLAVVGEAGLQIYEMAPRKVKQAVVGYGAAQKIAVAKMVQRVLKLAEPPAPDAADALGLALAFAQQHGTQSLNPPKRV